MGAFYNRIFEHGALIGPQGRCPMTRLNTRITMLLTRLRDMRIVWDVMGSLYNRRIYDSIAELFEYIAGELTAQDKAQIIDAGAGRGYLSLLLASRNPEARVTGIDYSRMQVRRAESYRRQRNIFNCSFHQSDVLSLQFKDAAFDAAVSAGSIKHWSDSRRGLMELHRVLKPGGCLIIAETDREASDEDLRKFATRFHLPFVPKGLFFWGLRHVIFGQSFSQDQLADAVDRVGFHNVQCRRVPTCPYVIVKAWK